MEHVRISQSDFGLNLNSQVVADLEGQLYTQIVYILSKHPFFAFDKHTKGALIGTSYRLQQSRPGELKKALSL